MPRRQRAELFVRGRVKEDRWSDKKGRLTLQAAQVWEERDRRTDAAHRTTSFANASSKFKCRPLAHLLVSRFLQRNPDFRHPCSAKSATSHARSTWPATHPCHAATPGGAFSRLHGTKGMQAAFVTRPHCGARNAQRNLQLRHLRTVPRGDLGLERQRRPLLLQRLPRRSRSGRIATAHPEPNRGRLRRHRSARPPLTFGRATCASRSPNRRRLSGTY